MDISERARKIKLLLMDCDGVLTDGRLFISAEGESMKVFDVRDGQGLALWHAAGFDSGIISGRGAEDIIRNRAGELGVRFVRVKSPDKTQDIIEIAEELGLDLGEVAFVGDDIGDLEAVKMVGLGIAVRDAVSELKRAVQYKTKKRGGRGAVREVVELLLNSKRAR
jgi:3-deoxy-D-manno-octulosonate 8-phosphate phosphatase (KDO 8-P phosphatase)